MKPQAYIIVGLAFGDEGKGSMVNYLARLYGAAVVVRYNGGPQAAHNVVTLDGRHHTFAQFGSGSFAGARTHLSRFMLVEPFAMINEAEILSGKIGGDPFALLTADPLCPVITPYHWQLNRVRESARGANRHGSCGMGIGELRAGETRGVDNLLLGDLSDAQTTQRKLCRIRDDIAAEADGSDSISRHYRELILRERVDDLAEFYRNFAERVTICDSDRLANLLRGCVSVFEGAQGVLLDEDFGFAPYNSWTKTTADNAREILDVTDVPHQTIGVVRTYFTRHGPGPFVSEYPVAVADRFNVWNQWQGPLRKGLFDIVALRYALECDGGVDEIALTHVDQIGKTIKFVSRYRGVERLTTPCPAWRLADMEPIIEERAVQPSGPASIFEEIISLPINYISWGETAQETHRHPALHVQW